MNDKLLNEAAITLCPTKNYSLICSVMMDKVATKYHQAKFQDIGLSRPIIASIALKSQLPNFPII